MELDRRIIKGKKPFAVFDTEEAKKFIGETCYFTNYEYDFTDLDVFDDDDITYSRHIGVLSSVSDTLTSPFRKLEDSGDYYNYILPCECVKQEPKYRPYTMSEFKSEFKINTVLTLRKCKEHKYVYQTVYLGNRHYDDTDSDENFIYLSHGTYSLKELFEKFEIVRNGDWVPFGVFDNGNKS